MRFRSTLAMLTTVLMLSLSCVASACEASCDLLSFSASGHDGAKAGETMPGMPDCGMTSAKTSAAALQANAGCCHQAYEQAPAVTSAEYRLGFRMIGSDYVVSLAHPLVSPATPVAFMASKSPPLRAPLLVSLQTILRV